MFQIMYIKFKWISIYNFILLILSKDLTEKLKEQLETGCRKVVKSRPDGASNDDDDDEDNDDQDGDREQILTRSDKHGNLYPIQLQTSTDELNRKRKRSKKKIVRINIIFPYLAFLKKLSFRQLRCATFW